MIMPSILRQIFPAELRQLMLFTWRWFYSPSIPSSALLCHFNRQSTSMPTFLDTFPRQSSANSCCLCCCCFIPLQSHVFLPAAIRFDKFTFMPMLLRQFFPAELRQLMLFTLLLFYSHPITFSLSAAICLDQSTFMPISLRQIFPTQLHELMLLMLRLVYSHPQSHVSIFAAIQFSKSKFLLSQPCDYGLSDFSFLLLRMKCVRFDGEGKDSERGLNSRELVKRARDRVLHVI